MNVRDLSSFPTVSPECPSCPQDQFFYFLVMKTLSLLIKENLHTSEKYTVGDTKSKIILSRREEECLFYLLRGKSAKETAKLLGISYRTVEVHIDQIKYKFNCHTKSELFSKAIKAGYLYRIPVSLLKSS